MTSRNPNARRKTLESGNPRVESRNLNASEIIPSWAMRGKSSHDQASSLDALSPSSEAIPVHTTDEAALTCFYTKRTLCEWLQISTRSWDRAAAAGLTPAPDLVCGSSPRWSPSTVTRWLKSRPRLPGRKGAKRDNPA